MNAEDDRIRARIAAELTAVRSRSEGLTIAALDEAELQAQHSPLMSPLVWDYAHVGNYEEQWLLRAAAAQDPLRPDIDALYDAFEHPRDRRVELPLLRPDEAHAYNAEVRARVLDSLEYARLDAGAPCLTREGFVYLLVVQHEHQHNETMLATHQLRRGAPALPDGLGPPAAMPPRQDVGEVLVPGGEFTMGTSDDPWAYDNERPAHRVHLPPYRIAARAVTNAEHMDFIGDGGYRDPRWWSEAGRLWLAASKARAPAFWHREDGQWWRRRFGRLEPVPPEEPVQHVSFYEAEAHACWAGKRLPSEAEWEKAARFDPAGGASRRFPWGEEEPDHTRANLGQRRLRPSPYGTHPLGDSPLGAGQLIGDVWEWTADDFAPYPGFAPYPYPEYSAVFFREGGYKVLRGGSWATHRTAVRGTFRNWDFPQRRQIFAGIRLARDAEPGEGA